MSLVFQEAVTLVLIRLTDRAHSQYNKAVAGIRKIVTRNNSTTPSIIITKFRVQCSEEFWNSRGTGSAKSFLTCLVFHEHIVVDY
jgi:hypothetical protein